MDHTKSPALAEAVWSKVLPGSEAVRTMVVRTKYVDANPC